MSPLLPLVLALLWALALAAAQPTVAEPLAANEDDGYSPPAEKEDGAGDNPMANVTAEVNFQPEPPPLKLKPRVISFNVMVAGLSGLGKTTTCNMLFDAWQPSADGKKRSSRNEPRLRKPTRHVDVSRRIERYDARTNTLLRVRVVDTPGFGNNIDHKHAVRPILRYVRRSRDAQFRAQMAARPDGGGGAGGSAGDHDRLVHACVYFISPHRFLEIDRHFLRHVQRELAIVPVVAKADTLTDDELAEYRAMLRGEFEANGIATYDFGESRAVPRAGGARALFARGRQRGEPLGIVARDGTYPWGTSEFRRADHSDFALLQDLLLSEHTEPLIERAVERYAAYRARRVMRGRAADAAKTLAVAALAARALGAPLPTPDRVRALLGSVGGAVAALWRRLFDGAPPPPAADHGHRHGPFAKPPPPPPPPEDHRKERWRRPFVAARALRRRSGEGAVQSIESFLQYFGGQR